MPSSRNWSARAGADRELSRRNAALAIVASCSRAERERMISVTHVITGLEQGGAEVVLLRLLQRADMNRFRMRVISLSGEGHLAAQFRDIGVAVENLNMEGSVGALAAVARCGRLLKRHQPQVVQTWMYHGDLIGGVAARLARIGPVVWGLHAGTLPPSTNRLARAGIKVAARLSSMIPTRIVCCSYSACEVHSAAGYDKTRMVVIENGFDLVDAAPIDREKFRRELGVTEATPVITRIGRFHPQKDYPSLVAACGQVRQRYPDAVFVMVGSGVDPENEQLMQCIREAGIAANVRLLGLRGDIAAIHAASDLAVSSSAFGEALPLVLGEAMASGVPTVTTDVGDSARLVSDATRTVPASDPWALARAICQVLVLSPAARRQLGERDRKRIATAYSLNAMAESYFELYEQVASRRRLA